MWQECILCYEPTFFRSSLVKSKSTWLQLEALRFEGKKRYLCCINIVRTTQSLQMEISAHFVRFQADLYLHLGSSLILVSWVQADKR